MRISKEFIKSSLIYTLAGILPMASAILLLPFYIAGLDTSDYGALSIYLAFSLLIQILVTYSFDTSLYIHFHEYKGDKNKLAAFISSAFILMLFIGIGITVILFTIGDIFFRHIFSEKPISFYPYGLMAAGAGIFQALFKVHSNLLQSREKPALFFWSNLISFLMIAAFTILGLIWYPNTLVGPVGGRLLAAFISGLWAIGRIAWEFGWHFNFPLLRSSFSFNFYAFIYQLQQWVINYFDRFVMLFFLPLSSIGVYDFAIKCLLIIEFILNGLHNSFYPKVVKVMMAQDEKKSTLEINRYYNVFSAAIMLLTCFCILVIPVAIDWFVTSGYVRAKSDYILSVEYLPFIAVLYLIRPIRLYFAVPYNILKYTKPLPWIYIIVSVTKIILMIVLISSMKIYGVILSTAISAVLEFVLLRYYMRQKFTYQYNIFKILVAPLVLLAIIVSGELFLLQNSVILHSVYLLVCISLLYWAYRKEIKYVDGRNMLK
ncbi:MAG: oligosaccharide flippase family protein [Cyclobacteriaceae bacterium]|nr:oligosaccharide flippase family protein [Cyclobacteriaceae bacterium]